MISENPTLATVIAQPLTSPLVIVPSTDFDFSESIDRMRIPKYRAVTFAGVGFCILEDVMNASKVRIGTLITAAMLRDMDACGSQLREFERLWPNGFRIRKKNLLAAGATSLGIPWFAKKIFSGYVLGKEGEYEEFWHLYREVYCDYDKAQNIYLDAARAFWDVIKRR